MHQSPGATSEAAQELASAAQQYQQQPVLRSGGDVPPAEQVTGVPHRRPPEGSDLTRTLSQDGGALVAPPHASAAVEIAAPPISGTQAVREDTVMAGPRSGQPGLDRQPGSLPGAAARDIGEENAYLRRNVEHLRRRKKQMEEHSRYLEERVQSLERENVQYKDFYEQVQCTQLALGDCGGLEINMLHQQLNAVLLLKNALNAENLELQRLLETERERKQPIESSPHTACVVCMDNLANVVCLPCKHLSLCTFCSSQSITCCPICRSDIDEKMQIFMP